MKLKHIVYWNSVGKIRSMLEEMKKNGKVKFKRKVYKYKIPEQDYLSIPVKDMIEVLETESI